MLKKLVLNSRKYIKVVNQNAVRKGPSNIDSWTYLNPKEKEKKKRVVGERERKGIVERTCSTDERRDITFTETIINN